MKKIIVLGLLFSMGAYAHIPTESEKEKAKAKWEYINSEFFDCLRKDKHFRDAYCSKVKKRRLVLLKRRAGDPFKD